MLNAALMVRWLAIVVLCSSTIARAEFDPVGEDGWPKGTSLASLRGLPECVGPLRGEPGSEIPCRPPIAGGGSRIAYSMDWTTGLALGDGTSGGAQAWGHELLVAVTRNLQLGGRYELMGTGLDDRMATTVIGHHLLAIARYRLFTDEVERSAWTLGAGVGWSGDAPIARLAVGHDFGAFVTRSSALTSGLELAYERSFDDAAQQNLVGSVKLGFELGIRKPRNLADPAPTSHPASVHLGVLAMPGVAFGFDANVGFGRRRISWENSIGYLFGTTDDRKVTGIDGAQWSARTGARLHWWQVAYAQAQLGGAWVAGADGGHLEALWHGELGISLGCVETGVWLQQNFEGDRTSGGLLFRVGRGNRQSLCGGGRREPPRFAIEYIPPPPPPAPEPPVVVEKPPIVVEEPPVVVVKPPVVVIEPVVIELDVATAWVGRALVLRLDPRSLPIARLRGSRIAVELVGDPRLLAGAEIQLRQLLGGLGIRVDAWARVVAPTTGVRIRFTIAP